MTTDTLPDTKYICVIEDHDSVRVVIEQTLSMNGYEVATFDSAKPALAAIRKKTPDAILLDYKLPDMTGDEIIANLQKDECPAPFVVMTAFGSEEFAVDMMRLGASDYISKDENLVKKLPIVFERLFKQEQTRKKLLASEQKLQDSEKKFRFFFEESNGLLCTHDLRGKILSVNPAAAKSLGYTSDELVGNNMVDHLHTKSRALFAQYLENISSKKQGKGLMGVMDKRGNVRSWEYQNKLTVLPDGSQVVIGNAIDVTDKIQAQKALRDSEARLKQITNTINDVFYLYNIKEKKYEFMSPNCLEVLGVNQNFFYEKRSYTQEFVHEDDKERLFQANKEVDAGTAYDLDYRIWVRGELRWVNEKSFPIKNSDGDTIKNSGLVTDITDRKKAELKLKELYEDTARMNKIMSGREDRILELKQEVNRLAKELGKDVVYKSAEVE